MAIANLTAGRKLRASELNAIISKVNALSVPPMCIVRRVAAQSVASGGSGASVSFDTEDVDTDTMFAATSDTITIKTAGKYRVTCQGVLGSASGAVYQVNHGATVRARQDAVTQFHLETPVFTAAVNDTIKIGVFQSSGIAQNLTAQCSVIKESD